MTDAQIREAACDAFNAASTAPLINTAVFTEGALVCIDAVYRAGLAAGRAVTAAAKPKRAKKADLASDACLVTVAEMMRHGVEPVQAESWLRARKAKRLPLTRAAWEQTQAKAERAGITVCRLVEICAGEGWAGFNETWAIERGLLPRRTAASAETRRAREARERVESVSPGAARKTAGAGLGAWQDAIEGLRDGGPKRIG